MNAKDAISAAKAYVADVFSGEQAINLGLEEITFDPSQNVWEVTIGFSRPWDQLNPQHWLNPGEPPRYTRTYKVVRLSEGNGAVLGITNRLVEAA